jgi:hypothetical protein
VSRLLPRAWVLLAESLAPRPHEPIRLLVLMESASLTSPDVCRSGSRRPARAAFSRCARAPYFAARPACSRAPGEDALGVVSPVAVLAAIDATGEIFGDVPNIAARAQTLAEPGSVVVTARAQRQIAGLFAADRAQATQSTANVLTTIRQAQAVGYTSCNAFAGVVSGRFMEHVQVRQIPNGRKLRSSPRGR